jgi:probable HAF family extracellular repeat protein
MTDIAIPYTGNGYYTYNHFYFMTSNNLGVNAGTANTINSAASGDSYLSGVTFTPDPHTVHNTPNSIPFDAPTAETSPGYLGGFTNTSTTTYGQFYGTVAGINDHGNLALNEFNWPNGLGVVTPHLSMGYTDISLGSLGGNNGAAYALNNFNQVVGWSQIANGAQHAFLYSNGTMQDLNLLIPPLSGITLTSAVGIDSAGEIVAFGSDASGQTNEYLLTPLESPVPEPSSLAVFTVMIGTFVIRKVARC